MAKRKAPMWFRLPVDAEPPPLISESVGFLRLVAKAADSYTIEVNVLDADEARLLRAGVVVAHRRRGDVREWYVSAPTWPGLPAEATFELDESGDLPAPIRRKINLFLRSAPLGPLATVECRRRAYSLRGEDGPLVDILDEVVTTLRDGRIHSRVREITMTPLVKLDGQQRDFILSALSAVGATVIDHIPTLQQRIGPPATGLTSFREPLGFRRDMTLEEFVSEIFQRHLHRLVLAQLSDDAVVHRGELAQLHMDLRGLSAVLEPRWREDLERELRALPAAQSEDQEPILLRIVDALVGAVRAPKLGNLSVEPASSVLYSRVEQSLMILFDRCRALEEDSPDDAWAAALRSAEQLDAATVILEPLFRKPVGRIRKGLRQMLAALQMSVHPPEDIQLVGMSAEEAYQLGRDVEHAQWSVARARREFIQAWPDHVGNGRKALKKMRKRMS